MLSIYCTHTSVCCFHNIFNYIFLYLSIYCTHTHQFVAYTTFSTIIFLYLSIYCIHGSVCCLHNTFNHNLKMCNKLLTVFCKVKFDQHIYNKWCDSSFAIGNILYKDEPARNFCSLKLALLELTSHFVLDIAYLLPNGMIWFFIHFCKEQTYLNTFQSK